MIEQAFHDVCNQAQETERWYVSLYQSIPFYGGPEEGGWWGSDTVLVAHQQFVSKEQADSAAERVQVVADEAEKDAREAHGRQCQAEIDYCDERGIDDYNAVFGETSGPDSFFVQVEQKLGSSESRGCRHWS